MRVLLDSDAYSGFMSGSHRVRDIVQDAEQVLMSAVVVAELLYGFRQGQRLEQYLAELQVLSRQAIRVVRARRTSDRRPILQDHGVAQGEGDGQYRQTTSGSPHTRWRPARTWSPRTATSDT